MATQLRQQLALEAARIVCEEQLTDYRLAKQKAAQRLGLGHKFPLPENALVHTAVLDYLRLFGGSDYIQRLQQLRQTAVDVMGRLEAFEPRLVGAVVSGAVTAAHRIQLHAFCEKAESLELALHNFGVACEQGDRSYRFPDGSEIEMPLTSFDFRGFGVDVAIFEPGTLHERPLNPLDGLAFKRLDLKQAQDLMTTDPLSVSS